MTNCIAIATNGRRRTAPNGGTSLIPYAGSSMHDDAPFRDADEALRFAYYTIAKKGLGVKGTLGWVGVGGDFTPAEAMAQASMIISTMRDHLRDPFKAAIEGAFTIANDWPSRNEKAGHLKRLSPWINCPRRDYKMHCLGAWSGMHQINEDRWARRIGVTPRTLQRWRNGNDGVTVQADKYLTMALNVCDDVFVEAGLVARK